MCLAIPARIVELRADDLAVVDLAGVRKEISLALVDNVAVGDYVIVHVGYALNKLDPEEAAKTLALFAEIASRRPDTGSLMKYIDDSRWRRRPGTGPTPSAARRSRRRYHSWNSAAAIPTPSRATGL